MPVSFSATIRRIWNALRDSGQDAIYSSDIGAGSYYREQRTRLRFANEKSIVASVFTRLSIDVSSIPLQHVRLDENGRFLETIRSGLNECLTLEANIDQTGRSFIQDVVISMCDEGVVAIVPVDTTDNPLRTNSYDVLTMRTGKVIQWYPQHVRVEIYNDKTGRREELTLPKYMVAIVENPLSSVMNEPNSTLQRLIHKLNLLDVVDEQSSSGKLDLLVQLPYPIKTALRKAQADQRRQDLEDQLKGSKYGIGYIDATEKVTQLNRPAENNLMAQIEYLTNMLYGQLGMTKGVFDGTADEKQMLNYYSRTVDPISSTIAEAIKRTFISKTARTQGQSIIAIRDPFRMVPPSELAKMADSFTRNAVMTSNEFRGVMGLKPSGEKDADTLRNKNLNPSSSPISETPEEEPSLSSE